MTRNIGSIDRALRFIAGLALIAWAIVGAPASGYSWLGWIGLVPLLTALVSSCPAYSLLGVSTCPVAARKS